MQLTVTRHGLVPSAAYDQDRIRRYAIGSQVEAQLHQRPSNGLTRYVWTLVGAAAKGAGLDRDAYMNEIKVALGYIDRVETMDGEAITFPTSLAGMEEPALREFVRRVEEHLSLSTGLSPDEIISGADSAV